MAQVKDIITFAVEWREKLQHCRYAGEIYLDPDLLELLAREFRRYMAVEDSLFEIALVVLAVNCAYHYYDDQGFWPHFCRLLKVENTNAKQERLGRIIEKRLELLGLKKTERTGPFRYVGAILEQCGVSKRYINSLAGIIKQLKGFRSWNTLLTMGLKEFQDRVNVLNCSKYLKNFLKDTAGWKFTMQVCQLLMFYEQGNLTLADLKELPGYQPGFWDEFLVHFHDLNLERVKDRIPIPLRPRLVFVPEERCLAIRFPGRDYAEGVRIPAISNFWRFPLTLLKSAEAWSDYYTGSIPGVGGRPVEWILPGWLPDGLPALFDPGYGFVQRGRKVSPGEYWMLVPDGYNPPCRVISELGQVRVPGNINYRACRVFIEPGTAIPGYELEPDTGTDIALTWVEPEKFRLWCGEPWSDVFTGSLPPLAVSDFKPVEELRVAIFYTAGSVSGRIRNRRELEQVLRELNGSAPVNGRFSVYAIGRTGRPEAGSVLAEKEFYLLPPLNIRFACRLYAFNEEPPVEIDDSFPGRLNLDGCRRIDRNGRKWIIPVDIDRVTGTIECQDLVVGLNIAVYRARMYFADGKPVRYLLLTDLEQETIFLLTGCPDSEAWLGLWQQPAREIPVKFDSGGMVRISSDLLLELLRDCSHSINEVVLRSGDYTVSTGLVVFDLESVIADICAGAACRACVCTAGDLIRILDICSELCREVTTGRCYNLNRIPRFHPSLDEWIFSLFACACVFDRVNILLSGKKVNWTERVGNEKLCLLLDFIIRVQNGRWAGEGLPAGSEVLPPVERWKNALKQFFMTRIAGEGTADLSEWANEVRHHRSKFRSRIALMTGGYSLTGAWVRYHRGLFESALSLLNNMEEGPPVLRELRNFLCILLLLRLARIEAAGRAVKSLRSGSNLQPVFSLLEYVVKILNGDTVPEQQFQVEFLTHLPLRAEDRVFLEIASRNCRNSANLEVDPFDSQDWLLLWFLINSCSNSQRKIKLAEKLLGLRDRIQPSPEKTKIIERAAQIFQG